MAACKRKLPGLGFAEGIPIVKATVFSSCCCCCCCAVSPYFSGRLPFDVSGRERAGACFGVRPVAGRDRCVGAPTHLSRSIQKPCDPGSLNKTYTRQGYLYLMEKSECVSLPLLSGPRNPRSLLSRRGVRHHVVQALLPVPKGEPAVHDDPVQPDGGQDRKCSLSLMTLTV